MEGRKYIPNLTMAFDASKTNERVGNVGASCFIISAVRAIMASTAYNNASHVSYRRFPEVLSVPIAIEQSEWIQFYLLVETYQSSRKL